MANLQIRELPDELHEELRRRARMEGMSIRAYVARLIAADLALPPRVEWFARVRARRPIELGMPVADLVRDDRRERNRRPTDRRAR